MKMMKISQEAKKLYQEEGYMLLEGVIPKNDLDLLQQECQIAIGRMDKKMDAKNTDKLGVWHGDSEGQNNFKNQKGKRYFIDNCFKVQSKLRRFLFGELMAEICHATIGEDALLFWEQFVVKGAQEGQKFSWHQDSGYVNYPNHKPYLSCWCALDDMSESNGTLHLLPFSRSGIRSYVQHITDKNSNDKVGYFGSDPGLIIEMEAGSIVAFTSLNFHASGTNSTDKLRRAYVVQYSSEPIMTADGTKLWGNAEKFLTKGKITDQVIY